MEGEASWTGSLLQQLIFLPWLSPPAGWPGRGPDLSDPASRPALKACTASHLYISSPPGTAESQSRVGAWLLLPTQSSGRVERLGEEDTVVLYLHGNSSNRAQPHRTHLYHALLQLGYHVLAVDYRGFGDSSPVWLCESSVVADARAALDWVSAKLGDRCRVLVWGHSLGTAIASHMVADFDMETGGNSSVAGLVLESPFNNMAEEVRQFRASKALQLLVDLDTVLTQSDLRFETDKWLPAVKCPVLVLHAEDDGVVPHSLAARLVTDTTQAGKESIKLVSLPASEQCGHTDIYKSETASKELLAWVESLSKPASS